MDGPVSSGRISAALSCGLIEASDRETDPWPKRSAQRRKKKINLTPLLPPDHKLPAVFTVYPRFWIPVSKKQAESISTCLLTDLPPLTGPLIGKFLVFLQS